MPVFNLFSSKLEHNNKSTEEKIPKYIKRTKSEKIKAYYRNGLYYIDPIFEEMPVPKDIDYYQKLLDEMFKKQIIKIFDPAINYCLWCSSKINEDIAKTELYKMTKHIELLKRSIRMFKHHEITDIYFFFGPNIEERNKFKELLNKKIKNIYNKLNLDIKYLDEQYQNAKTILKNTNKLVMNNEIWETYIINTYKFIEEIKNNYSNNI